MAKVSSAVQHISPSTFAIAEPNPILPNCLFNLHSK